MRPPSTYLARVGVTQRMLYILAIDQSESVEGRSSGIDWPAARAELRGRWIEQMLMEATFDQSGPADLADVVVLGYGTNGSDTSIVNSPLKDALAESNFVRLPHFGRQLLLDTRQETHIDPDADRQVLVDV